MKDDELTAPAARSPRQRTLLRGVLRRERATEGTDIRIRNLSSGGLLAIGGEALDQGERVTVTLRELGEISGIVVWSETDGMGIAFDHAIDPGKALQPARTQPPPRFVAVQECARRPGLRVRRSPHTER